MLPLFKSVAPLSPQVSDIVPLEEQTGTMATVTIPSYNTDHPATLFAPGRLRGLAVQLDPSSITPLAGTGGRIYRATLSGPNAFPHLRGGQFATVAVKVTEDDRTRRPRDPKREARILADLDHPNVRPTTMPDLLLRLG